MQLLIIDAGPFDKFHLQTQMTSKYTCFIDYISGLCTIWPRKTAPQKVSKMDRIAFDFMLMVAESNCVCCISVFG